ncbi:MAG: hypothetical protein ABEI78_01895 [Candidatus Nanohaloarchaea archaeon]
MLNKLPDKIDVSKATVSRAVNELGEEVLIKRRKKGNTYLIELDKGEIEDRQR